MTLKQVIGYFFYGAIVSGIVGIVYYQVAGDSPPQWLTFVVSIPAGAFIGITVRLHTKRKFGRIIRHSYYEEK
jgi:hypothetical protein